MSRLLRPTLGVVAAYLLLGPFPAAAPAAATQGARETGTNSVRAQLRFVDGQNAEVPVWTELRISITRNEQTIAKEQPLPPAVATSYFTAPKLLAVDLDDDGDPEVMVDVFTAGYSCCQRTAILRFDGQQYAPQLINWDTAGYELLNVGGGSSPEFLADDARFPRLFSNADARGPLRILRLVDGRLRDVTDTVPARLRRDARTHASALRKARSRDQDTRAALAAYVVDLARLGRVGEAQRAIAHAAKRRELKTTGGGFARRIDARMIAWGYASRPLLSGVATPAGVAPR